MIWFSALPSACRRTNNSQHVCRYLLLIGRIATFRGCPNCVYKTRMHSNYKWWRIVGQLDGTSLVSRLRPWLFVLFDFKLCLSDLVLVFQAGVSPWERYGMPRVGMLGPH